MFKFLAAFLLIVSYAAAQATNAGQAFAQDINNLDFQNIIGGPMNAVVDAQVQAALSTVTMLNAVGFFENSAGRKEVVMMKFNYRQVDSNGTEYMRQMELPFLYLIPLPYIVFTKLQIDFNMKLNAIGTVNKDTNLAVTAGLTAPMPFTPVQIDLRGNVAFQKSQSNSARVERDYSMKINVVCSQAEQPEGIQSILRLFESIVTSELPDRN